MEARREITGRRVAEVAVSCEKEGTSMYRLKAMTNTETPASFETGVFNSLNLSPNPQRIFRALWQLAFDGDHVVAHWIEAAVHIRFERFAKRLAGAE